MCAADGLRQEMRDAKIQDLVRSAWNDQLTRARAFGVTLSGEANREKPRLRRSFALPAPGASCVNKSRREPRRLLEAAGDQFFQFHDVGREFANSFSSLVDRHRIFVELEAKGLFVESDFFSIRSLRDRRVEFAGDWFE
jgi:hypothetical protein